MARQALTATAASAWKALTTPGLVDIGTLQLLSHPSTADSEGLDIGQTCIFQAGSEGVSSRKKKQSQKKRANAGANDSGY